MNSSGAAKKWALWRPFFALVLTALLQALIFWADISTGPLIAFTPYYFVPIGLAAWHVSASAGYGFALIACLCRSHVFGNLFPHDTYWLYAHDFLANLAVFFVFAYLVIRVRRQIVSLTEQSQRDALTGAYNRRYFFETGAIELARAFRHHYPLSVAYIDVDDFKALNDKYGHAAGDQILADIAESLNLDLRDGDTLARVGGDEFALLLPHTDLESAKRALERIQTNLVEMMAEGEPRAALSMGCITYLADKPLLFDELLHAADRHLYQAKQTQKGSIQFALV